MKKTFGVIACLAFLAGCGADVAGEWSGTWSDSSGRSGELVLQISQGGGDVLGTLTTFGLPCLASATVSGSIDGDNLDLTAAKGESQIQLLGTVAEDEISGTFTIPTGGACGGAKGDWKANR